MTEASDRFAMRSDEPIKAPDFTNACVVMFGVNITWIFTVIWAIWGLIIVMIVGAFINHMMTRLHARAMRRAAIARAHPKASARW